MKGVFILVFWFIIFMSMVNNISAWGPHTHNYIVDNIKENKQQLGNLSICFNNSENEESFRGGMLLPDITVLDYIFEKKNYQSTHNSNFYENLINSAESDKDKCLAYGVAVHIISDRVAHGRLMPLKAQETKLPIWMIHPFIEEKYDECLASMNKNLVSETEKSLDVFYGEKKEEYIKKIGDSLGKSDFNAEKKINKLKFVLNVLKIPVSIDGYLIASSKILEKSCDRVEIEDYMKQTESLIRDNFRE